MNYNLVPRISTEQYLNSYLISVMFEILFFRKIQNIVVDLFFLTIDEIINSAINLSVIYTIQDP